MGPEGDTYNYTSEPKSTSHLDLKPGPRAVYWDTASWDLRCELERWCLFIIIFYIIIYFFLNLIR